MRKRILGLFLFACCETACGGGAGGAPAPTPPQATPSIGTASGTVVDDPTGTPLQGVTVRLDPWVAFATPGPTPTPIQTTTTDSNGRFQFTMPFGTYLLVIGDDKPLVLPPPYRSPSAATGPRATIHDRIDFRGQPTLIAPTLVAQPFYTPPAVETSGSYRLSILDVLLEGPCYWSYNQARNELGLPPAVLDEWLTENVRALIAAAENPNAAGAQITFLTSGAAHESVNGGTDCRTMIDSNATFSFDSQASQAAAQWFAGAYAVFANGTQAAGFAEFPLDPRLQQTAPAWP